MNPVLYIEKMIYDHPRAQNIIQRVRPKHIILCDHYKEIFNPKSQNFRIQKQNPSIILAKKQGKLIFKTPPKFGIGGCHNYYFSHMLNCLYDCRYCFLQGMYSSAHYVMFINYEEMMEEIKNITEQINETIYFFSGYDCDSLAFEPVTHFVKNFLPFFNTLENAFLELRTKSTDIRALLKLPVFKNIIIAFSFTPEEISQSVEFKVPSVSKRIAAMHELSKQGWLIGIRLDPLIYHPKFSELYKNLIDNIFKFILPHTLHSISVGQLRFPEKMYQSLIQLYPSDPLLNQSFHRENGLVSYQKNIEISMKTHISFLLKQYITPSILFECQS